MSLFSKKSGQVGAAPLAGRELLLSDLDGIVYRGAQAIDYAVDALNRASTSMSVGYVTNNASRRDIAVAEQLAQLGLGVKASDIVTSPQSLVQVLKQTVPSASTIFVVGGEGLTYELELAGFTVTRSADDRPAAVVQGFAPEVGWKDLAEASFALQNHTAADGSELPWLATNTDWTYPLERGIAPGNGTLVSAVHIAVGRLPVFTGKPQPQIFETAFERFGTRNALMLGDRLDTDIQGARSVGIDSALVLTGIDRPKQLLAATEPQRPTYILGDLRDLEQPYPVTEVAKDGSITVGNATVTLDAHVVRIVREGDDRLNLLRAGCEAIWRSGLAIYGLQVPGVLYEDVF